MKMIAARISLLIALVSLLAPDARAQNFIFTVPSGALSADTTTPAKMAVGQSATIFLNFTTLTLGGDHEIDCFIQTTYDGATTWTDLQNIHFDNSDNGSTAKKTVFITPDLDGPGAMLSLTGTNPAANTEIIETVPANTIWRLWGAYATLVTDATAANRRVKVVIDDGSNTVFASDASAVHVASQTEAYIIGPRAGVVADHWIPTPTGMLMMAGWRMQTSTTLLKAGDNWSAPQLTIEAWADPENSTDGTMGDDLKAYRPMGSQVRIKVTITGATAPTFAFTARGVFNRVIHAP